MSTENSINNKTIITNIPANITGLLHPYHERYLADDSLSDIIVILLALYLIEYQNASPGSTRESLKQIFVWLGRKEEPNFKVNLHLAKKQGLIDEEGVSIVFRIKGLKLLEKKIGLIGKSPIRLIKAGQNFSGVKLLEEFLLQEVKDKDIFLCDSYVSSSTLFPFSILTGKLGNLKILTSNIEDIVKFKDYLEKLNKEEKIHVSVRKTKKIHDRYLISGSECWSFGTSINKIGNKDTIITQLFGIFDSLKELFDERWENATPI